MVAGGLLGRPEAIFTGEKNDFGDVFFLKNETPPLHSRGGLVYRRNLEGQLKRILR